MKISLNWLKNYIDISNLSVDEIARYLTMSGLEVESIDEIGKDLKGFVVGEVVSKKNHPNADKLSLCQVNNGSETFQVVCGAPNVEQGQKIVFAQVGLIIPSTGEKLKKAKIRGIESQGMICSEKELGLGENHTGILVLSKDAVVGEPIIDSLKLSDVVLEIGITPNRPDALSHIGVARELSAILRKKYSIPKIDYDEIDESIGDNFSVSIENEVDCPRYCALIVRNVKVKESPQWLRNYLSNVGLRPLNNIVDISNFVLLEYGQPIHTFDAKLVEGNKIIIKNADENEKFVTLDGKERILWSDTLMISDPEKKIAIAGVMGGKNSEITSATKDVIIEGAYFNPKSIRRTSKFLGLSTDASYRFERGVDHKNTLTVAKRVAQLIAELADGEILAGYIDEYPSKIEDVEVTVRSSRVKKVLGIEIDRDEISEILEHLGFEVRKLNGSDLVCKVPSFRPDITREIDVIEEVARIHGYENIEVDSRVSFTVTGEEVISQSEKETREILSGFGLNEVINNTLMKYEEVKFSDYKPIKILNPISQELSHLRTSLIPGLVRTISANHKFSEFDLMLYEIGNCMYAQKDIIENFNDFSEKQNIAIALTGSIASVNWREKPTKADIFYLKGLVETYLDKISLDKISFTSYNDLENDYYNIEVKVFTDSTYIGSLYKLSHSYLTRNAIEREVFVAELDFSKIKSLPKLKSKFNLLSNYPKVERDLSFLIDDSITYKQIEEKIYQSSDKLLKKIMLFDQYRDEKMFNRKSLAVRLEFQSYEKTLTNEEVDKRIQKIVNVLEKEFNVQIRAAN